MFGDKSRFITFDETPEALKMCLVERLRTADRHAHAMQRHGIVAANGIQRAMRRSSPAHVVFGVNLEEAAMIAGRCSCFKLVPARPSIGCAAKRRGTAADAAAGLVIALMPFLRFAAFVCVVGSPQRGANEP